MPQTSPIPGNIGITRNEADRLHALATQWEDIGHALRGLRTDDWLGAAADDFRAAQHERGNHWLNAADCHARAGDALRGYLDTLAEVQRLADSAIEEATRSGDPVRLAAAWQSVARWREQLADAGRKAAAIVAAANADLAALHNLRWPERPGPPTAGPVAPLVDDRPPPVRPPAPAPVAIEPPGPFEVRDPSYQRRLAALNNAVLAFWRT